MRSMLRHLPQDFKKGEKRFSLLTFSTFAIFMRKHLLEGDQVILFKDLVRAAAELLSEESVLSVLDEGSEDEQAKQTLTVLSRCANSVYSEVAVEYVPVIAEDVVESEGKTVPYSALSRTAREVLCVRDEKGKRVPFDARLDGVWMPRGKMCVHYIAVPAKKTLEDSLDHRDGLLDVRVLAYGVCAEFSMVSGMFEEALMWDKKYRDGLSGLMRRSAEIRLPKRSLL